MSWYKGYFEGYGDEVFYGDSPEEVIQSALDHVNATHYDADASEAFTAFVICTCEEVPLPLRFHAESFVRSLEDHIYEEHDLVTYSLGVGEAEEEDLEACVLEAMRGWAKRNHVRTGVEVEGSAREISRYGVKLDSEGIVCLTDL